MELGIVIDDSRTAFIDLKITDRGMESRLSSGRTWTVDELKRVIAAMEAPRWIRAVEDEQEAARLDLLELKQQNYDRHALRVETACGYQGIDIDEEWRSHHARAAVTAGETIATVADGWL
ncbi:hypothetical protein ABIB17_000479 [Arthrobacter sp. UYEF6]